MRASIAALGLLLAACAAPAPQPAGPIMMSGVLQGGITDNVYRDKRGWFTVATPVPAGGDDYRNMLVQEAYPERISFVNFIPQTAPGEYYRAYVEDFFAGNHPVPSLSTIADNALKVYGKQLMDARLEPMVLQQEKPWNSGATQGLMRLYTQKVSTALLAHDLMQGLALADDYTAYILLYITARNGKVAMLWAEWPEDCSVCPPIPSGPAKDGADAIDRALASNTRAAAFLRSFGYAAGASAYQ
ncbi:MAG TPA: hypothetical protein VFV77_03630 [Gammaproteobacteria bacterium]|nr:hypothetical protein [Gammaproteobacteria bacterium]